MKDTISLGEVFQVLRKRFLLIIIIAAIFTVATGIISYFFLTPVYQASTQILVNQSKSNKQLYQPNEVQANLQLINTYNVIIKSPVVLDKVIEKEHLKMSSEALDKSVSVSNAQDSQVVNITVQSKNPQTASNVANAIATTFQSEIKSLMNIDNVSILTKADKGSMIKPNSILNVMVALVIGIIVGVGVSFLLQYLDNTIKDDQDIEAHLGLPVLGAVAIINTSHNIGENRNKINVYETGGDSIGN